MTSSSAPFDPSARETGSAPLIRPDDAENRRLVSLVHPPTWRNPEPKGRYHLVVVGAGTAGLVSAAGAAGLGARVALVERHLMGGDCLNVGCVPSKGLIAPARAWHAARHAARDFHGPDTSGDGDFASVMARMRRLRADIASVDSAARFQSLGVDVFFGDAVFTGPDTIHVDGVPLRFRRGVIATGARAAAPAIAGLSAVPYLTNETLFELTERPRHLLVVGGGPIGCEMAQAFARLGSRVTLINRGPRLLPRDDADAATLVHRSLSADGVQLLLGVDIQHAGRDGGEISLDLAPRASARDVAGAPVAPHAAETRSVTGSHLLIAVGRAPNTEGLGLDAAGVAYTAAGVTVDDRFRTSNSRIYACGDVASPLQFTHLADFQARAVIQNALFYGRKKGSDLVVPWTTYTSPEVAQVGHTEASAREAGLDVQTFHVSLGEVDRAILDGETDGFARVHVQNGTDRIVGATIVAEHAGDLLAEVTLCMSNRIGLAAIGATMHPYPTQGDALRRCADLWRKTKLTPTVKSVFAAWFRWTG
ncbi:MAG: mercuric reductase [Gemmatimonadota bacterium]